MKINYRHNHFGEDVFTTVNNPRNHFFEITQYGTTHQNSAYELYHNPHNHHVFEYVISGKGYINTADSRHEVSEGDFYFLRQGFVGHYGADKDKPYKKIWINAQGSMINTVADMFDIHTPVLIRHTGEEAEAVIRSVHSLLDTSEVINNRKLLEKCSVKIYELLSLVMGCEHIESAEYRQRFSDKVKQYIDCHIFDPVDLDEIASHFFINSSYLIRKFRRETGITPMRYYNMCRIKAARSLLSFNELPVKEVASLLNYSDSAYFSNRFKEETGFSPSEYTKEIHAKFTNDQSSK